MGGSSWKRIAWMHIVSRDTPFCWLCVAPILCQAAGNTGRLRGWTLEEWHHRACIRSLPSATQSGRTLRHCPQQQGLLQLLGVRSTPKMCLRALSISRLWCLNTPGRLAPPSYCYQIFSQVCLHRHKLPLNIGDLQVTWPVLQDGSSFCFQLWCLALRAFRAVFLHPA